MDTSSLSVSDEVQRIFGTTKWRYQRGLKKGDHYIGTDGHVRTAPADNVCLLWIVAINEPAPAWEYPSKQLPESYSICYRAATGNFGLNGTDAFGSDCREALTPGIVHMLGITLPKPDDPKKNQVWKNPRHPLNQPEADKSRAVVNHDPPKLVMEPMPDAEEAAFVAAVNGDWSFEENVPPKWIYAIEWYPDRGFLACVNSKGPSLLRPSFPLCENSCRNLGITLPTPATAEVHETWVRGCC